MNTQERRQGAGFISLEGVSKRFTIGDGSFTALDSVSLTLNRGEFVAIVGRSGSGKSTLLNIVAAIDRPSEGAVFVDGQAVHLMNENRAAAWRGAWVGIVFQFFQLLPSLTILENVMLPMEFSRRFKGARESRAMKLLARVGVDMHAGKLPSALSGGEQQRAAIARALANDPPLILADEPTGNLDSHTAEAVLAVFRELSLEGRTVVMVTHEKNVTDGIHRTITLSDGMIVG
ncbi:MAG: ABC transporter ATP-binding protein [Spirochaetes bacterium]|nr:MAG: ABC transporter ATP-binding protein [Spirochaetota bacterium]